ncbi:MAG TPA: thiol:disulfide interchange protein DsbA/DsbL [Gallionellaceae bacterium]
MKLIQKFLAVMMVLFAAAAFAQSEGEVQYTTLNPPQPTSTGNKIEVLEFFFYGCIHCYNLHPALSAWEKTMPRDVQLDFVPVAFNAQWEQMVYTFYALSAMGKRKQLDDALYEAWHNRVALYSLDQIADFVAQNGVNRKEFVDNYNSFSVQSSAKQTKQMLRTYQIEGTPTLIVDGKYVISGLEPEDAIRVLDQLIKKARKEHGRRR